MRVRVLYFAVARELAGCGEDVLELPAGATIADARAAVAARAPRLRADDRRLRVARNEAFADEDEALEDGDVLALVPPVAGG